MCREAITNTNLWKHVGSYSQLLNLTEAQTDQLAKFMGHTTKTQKAHYRTLMEDVFNLAKVGKILMVMEQDDGLTKYHGKSLDEIEKVKKDEAEHSTEAKSLRATISNICVKIIKI